MDGRLMLTIEASSTVMNVLECLIRSGLRWTHGFAFLAEARFLLTRASSEFQGQVKDILFTEDTVCVQASLYRNPNHQQRTTHESAMLSHRSFSPPRIGVKRWPSAGLVSTGGLEAESIKGSQGDQKRAGIPWALIEGRRCRD